MGIEDSLTNVVRCRLKYKEGWEKRIDKSMEYDGFDMSGYNGSNYKNMELLARFSDLLHISERDRFFVIPIFWKGSCTLVEITNYGESKVIDELGGGFQSDEIVIKILKHVHSKLYDCNK